VSPLSPRTRTIDVLDPDQLGFDELSVEEHPRDEPNSTPRPRAVRARAAAEEAAPAADSMRARTEPGEIDPLAGLRLRLRRAAQPDPVPGSADPDHGGRGERLAATPTPSRRPPAAARPQRRTPKLEAAHLDHQAERPPEQVAEAQPAVQATRRGRVEHSRVRPLALAAVISGLGALVVAVTSHHPQPSRPTTPLRAVNTPPAQILGAARPVTRVATRTSAPRPAHPAPHRAPRVAHHHRAAVRAYTSPWRPAASTAPRWRPARRGNRPVAGPRARAARPGREARAARRGAAAVAGAASRGEG